MMGKYYIWWEPAAAYIPKRQSNRCPYTENLQDAKSWKTLKNAERFLSTKDARWASQCVIICVEIFDG